jgi:hypothetical protein
VTNFRDMRFVPRDTRVDVAELQARGYREMSPSEKLACADALYDLAWAAATAGVRMRHPDLDESAVSAAAREIFRNASN